MHGENAKTIFIPFFFLHAQILKRLQNLGSETNFLITKKKHKKTKKKPNKLGIKHPFPAEKVTENVSVS